MLLFQEVDCFDSLALSDGDEIGNHRFLSTGHLPNEDLMIRIEITGEKLGDIWITNGKTTIWTKTNQKDSRCRFFVSPLIFFHIQWNNICLRNKKRKTERGQNVGRQDMRNCGTRRRMYRRERENILHKDRFNFFFFVSVWKRKCVLLIEKRRGRRIPSDRSTCSNGHSLKQKTQEKPAHVRIARMFVEVNRIRQHKWK